MPVPRPAHTLLRFEEIQGFVCIVLCSCAEFVRAIEAPHTIHVLEIPSQLNETITYRIRGNVNKDEYSIIVAFPLSIHLRRWQVEYLATCCAGGAPPTAARRRCQYQSQLNCMGESLRVVRAERQGPGPEVVRQRAADTTRGEFRKGRPTRCRR